MTLSILVLGSVVTAGVAAQTNQPGWADDLYTDAETMVSTYNEQVEGKDLGTAAGQLKGEKINLVISDGQTAEVATFSFRMDNELRITELKKGARDDATLEMATNRQTVQKINEANSPGFVFRNAIKSRDISINGVSTVNKIKWTVINGVGGALGLFD
ncbi:hypothetical protein VB773_05770 [Haloarculaceae archaeon H-GB2-1]|nr:hypothetical protein [Haloarculaceae archaeon H-GB2-1]